MRNIIFDRLMDKLRKEEFTATDYRIKFKDFNIWYCNGPIFLEFEDTNGAPNLSYLQKRRLYKLIRYRIDLGLIEGAKQ